MQNLSPASRYQLALNEGTHQPDDVQREAVNRLEMIYQELTTKPAEVEQNGGLKAAFGRLLGKKAPQAHAPVRGLYMWGGVGRGKTWLMDMFYLSLPGARKQRLHFHRFMLRVHEELTALQGKSDPLEIVADRFKAETDVLCFDEFFVSDITDAMLLGGLMKALFARGITLVATSNIPPDELYRNGLQRARFLPAIDAIKQHCDIMNVDAGVDYRLRTLTQAHLWLSPLNSETRQQMDKLGINAQFQGASGIVSDAYPTGTGALIMFAGIYYGGMYGGSTTSILLNTPGESASIITALEGNKMARKGRGGPALATAAIGSFIAGLIATLLLGLLSVLEWSFQGDGAEQGKYCQEVFHGSLLTGHLHRSRRCGCG